MGAGGQGTVVRGVYVLRCYGVVKVLWCSYSMGAGGQGIVVRGVYVLRCFSIVKV
jgi:hypothetical protein